MSWMLNVAAFTYMWPFFFVMRFMFKVFSFLFFCWLGCWYGPHVFAMCLYAFFSVAPCQNYLLTLRVLITYFFYYYNYYCGCSCCLDIFIIWHCIIESTAQHHVYKTMPLLILLYFAWAPKIRFVITYSGHGIVSIVSQNLFIINRCMCWVLSLTYLRRL